MLVSLRRAETLKDIDQHRHNALERVERHPSLRFDSCIIAVHFTTLSEVFDGRVLGVQLVATPPAMD